jgi:TIR domain
MMPTTRNTFIFQAKKQQGDQGDLRIFIVEGLTDTWLASKYRRTMAPGDIVFFWMAGPPEIRGIYGWGVLISVDPPDLQDSSSSVQVRYERRFGSPLLATTLKIHRRLRMLPVLRNPVGTNFLVPQALARDLAEQVRLSGNEAPNLLLAHRTFSFDVALSFASEDRRRAEKLEELLRAEGLRVYFDGGKQSDLWGKRLRRRLADVYTKESKYCVILVSEHYQKKRWIIYEWTLLRRRLRQELPGRRDDPAVLPVKLDDTNLDHLPEDCAYLDARIVGLRRIAECVVRFR